MEHGISLILTLTYGLTTALIFGYIIQKIGLSPLIGYLLAGILISPYSPGVTADINIAQEFAEIGVVLLMFGVGLNFHLSDLISAYKIALPGAVIQIVTTTIITLFATKFLGWSTISGIIFGISISVASTVVLTRVLEDNRNLHTPVGHTAVGWLVIEDIFTILVLVILPALFANGITKAAPFSDIAYTLLITLLKIAILIVFTLVVGQKLLPLFLEHIAKTGSRDLFTLSVLVIALGIAVTAAKFFGTSMALGAFLAGMVVGQSDFSARATSEALPISDAFAVLFFVSVGMLFDFSSVIASWRLALLTFIIVLFVKPLIATIVVLLLKQPLRKAISIGVVLGQIGEFSFILVALGVTYKILPAQASSAIVIVSIITITLNAIMYKGIDKFIKFLLKLNIGNKSYSIDDELAELDKEHRHVIVVGYGPVGRTITNILLKKGINVIIIEMNIDTVHMIKKSKIEGLYAIHGNASHRSIISCSQIETAEAFIISSPVAPAKEIIEVVKSLNPRIKILVHTSYSKEAQSLRRKQGSIVFSGEGTVALALSKAVLKDLGTLDEIIERELKQIYEELV